MNCHFILILELGQHVISISSLIFEFLTSKLCGDVVFFLNNCVNSLDLVYNQFSISVDLLYTLVCFLH